MNLSRNIVMKSKLMKTNMKYFKKILILLPKKFLTLCVAIMTFIMGINTTLIVLETTVVLNLTSLTLIINPHFNLHEVIKGLHQINLTKEDPPQTKNLEV